MRTALLEEKLDFNEAVEAHWSAGTVLAIFIASALISAVFFGLGYSFGPFGTTRPAVASASGAAENVGSSDPLPPAANRRTQRHVLVAASRPSRAQDNGNASHTDATGSRYMVQVAATGSRKDARRLASKLRRRGFHPEILPGKHDKYLHVQLGPFADAEQAQTARHRLGASGFHAILTHSS